MSENINVTNLADFENYVNTLKQSVKRQYDRNINKDLSQQKWQELFRRNVIHVIQEGYDNALTQLQHLSSNLSKAEKNAEGSRFTSQALQYLDGFADELMQYALQQHRRSCAMSNFPDEHHPAQDYIAAVIQDIEREWEYFVFQVDAVMEH